MHLAHLRVIEIGSSAATAYCARMFADFGASVVKVESPAGDPIRSAGPLTAGGNSAWFSFLNFNKSSVVIDARKDGAADQLLSLVATADVLLDGRQIDTAGCPAFDLHLAKQRNPSLVYLDVSWFGAGPYARFEATDFTIRALAGLTRLVGPVA